MNSCPSEVKWNSRQGGSMDRDLEGCNEWMESLSTSLNTWTL